jgi:hypothetical protein
VNQGFYSLECGPIWLISLSLPSEGQTRKARPPHSQGYWSHLLPLIGRMASFEIRSGVLSTPPSKRNKAYQHHTQPDIHRNSPRLKVPVASRPIFSRSMATTSASAAAWRAFMLSPLSQRPGRWKGAHRQPYKFLLLLRIWRCRRIFLRGWRSRSTLLSGMRPHQIRVEGRPGIEVRPKMGRHHHT